MIQFIHQKEGIKMDEIKRILSRMCRQDMNKAVAQISEFICKENLCQAIEDFILTSSNNPKTTVKVKVILTDRDDCDQVAIFNKEVGGVKWTWEKQETPGRT